jgi:hypothetical protein
MKGKKDLQNAKTHIMDRMVLQIITNEFAF